METGELLRIATPNALELDKSCPSLGALFQAARQTAKVIQLQQQSLNLNIHRVWWRFYFSHMAILVFCQQNISWNPTSYLYLVLFYQIRDLKGYFILLLHNFDIVVVWYDVMWYKISFSDLFGWEYTSQRAKEWKINNLLVSSKQNDITVIWRHTNLCWSSSVFIILILVSLWRQKNYIWYLMVQLLPSAAARSPTFFLLFSPSFLKTFPRDRNIDSSSTLFLLQISTGMNVIGKS